MVIGTGSWGGDKMGVIVWGYMAIVCVSPSRSRGLRSLFCE